MAYNTADVGVAPYPVATPGNPQRASNARTINLNEAIAEADARRPKLRLKLRLDGTFDILGVANPAVFFSPMAPLQPQAQGPERAAVGRAFDYPVGYNTRITPRNEEPIGFSMLRNLADGYDLLRLILETRKDQLVEAKWSFGPKDAKLIQRPGRTPKPGVDDIQKRCDQLTTFWEQPDREHSWQDWLRMLLEQLFVYDAPALHPIMTRGGDLYALQILDGATITRKLSVDGRTPSYVEGVAYQQILKGLPAVDYTTLVPRGQPTPTDPDGNLMPELVYKPRNLRVDRVYGYGPVEQVITTVNIALRRQLFQLQYYTDGAIPDLLMQVPETWNPDQIAKFQTWWDALLSGNTANRRRGLFIPHGVEPYNPKQDALKDEYDEWLARIICFAFSISPTPFIRQMNRATAQTQQEQSKEEGLQPIQRWITDLVDAVTRLKFGWSDITLRWDEEVALGASEQAEVDVMLVKAKIYHPDEVRMQRGDDPMPDDMRAQMDLANFNEAVNSTVLPDEQQQAENDHALAMQAAKPAPVVASSAAKIEDVAALLKASPAPAISVDARTTIAEGAIRVDAPIDARHSTQIQKGAIEHHAPVTVNTPDVRIEHDAFIDVGSTNVNAKIETPKQKRGERSVQFGRDEGGNLVGKITETTTRTVRAEKVDGKLVAKIEE